MNFFDQMKQNELSLTENGAYAYKTSGKNLLDLDFMTSSLRQMSAEDAYEMFEKVWKNTPVLAIRWLFMLRDIRGGAGERSAFRKIAVKLLEGDFSNEIDIMNFFDAVVEYGRFDDVVYLYTNVKKETIQTAAVIYLNGVLDNDLAYMEKGAPISLCAKWMPSVNTSSAATRKIAKRLAKEFGWTEKEYRTRLAALRAYSNVTEVKISANKWSEIDYAAVPSKANLKYNKAFFKHDMERREDFIESVKRGETKVNAGALFPYDVVHQYLDRFDGENIDADDSLEVVWNSLPVDAGVKNILPIIDTSASMEEPIPSSGVTCRDVAFSLGLLFSERCSGCFKNQAVLFSRAPRLLDFSSDKTLAEKLVRLKKNPDYTKTNIEATFDLVLQTAINNHLPQDQMPEALMIVSDMQFDCATTDDAYKPLFKVIAEKYAAAGYKLPRLIFWNVDARGFQTIPMKENEAGVTLVGGFSQNLFKMVLSNDLDPYTALVKMLMSQRYNCAEEALDTFELPF